MLPPINCVWKILKKASLFPPPLYFKIKVRFVLCFSLSGHLLEPIHFPFYLAFSNPTPCQNFHKCVIFFFLTYMPLYFLLPLSGPLFLILDLPLTSKYCNILQTYFPRNLIMSSPSYPCCPQHTHHHVFIWNGVFIFLHVIVGYLGWAPWGQKLCFSYFWFLIHGTQ